MITSTLVQSIPLFAELPEEERASIASRAADVGIRAGEWLIREGEAPAFFGLLEGRLAVVKLLNGAEHTIATYVPGDYFGEVPLLLGTTAVAGLRAIEPARVMRLDPRSFRELITGCEVLSSEITRTLVRRVEFLQKVAIETPSSTYTVVGERLDPACHEVRDFLARNHVDFEWVTPQDPDAPRDLAESGNGAESLPAVVLPDGERLIRPGFRQLADRCGLRTMPRAPEYDLAIIGAGPAGLAAAVYAASEGLQTLIVERTAPGGQASTSSRIENYLGFPAGISGDELGLRALQQAQRFGADIVVARRVAGISPGRAGEPHTLNLDADGESVRSKAVIIAAGVAWQRLQTEGAERLVGRGVYYGAARTEALTVVGKDIHLVGGGNSAGQAALLLADYARTVTISARVPLANTMSRYLIDGLAAKPNVAVWTETEVVGIEGDQQIEAIVTEHRQTHERQRTPTHAVFVFIGGRAETGWVHADVLRDQDGYVCTGLDMLALTRADDAHAHPHWPLTRDPYLLETSVPGIFAAGDVRHGSTKRCASAVGEGSMAIAFVHEFLALAPAI